MPSRAAAGQDDAYFTRRQSAPSPGRKTGESEQNGKANDEYQKVAHEPLLLLMRIKFTALRADFITHVEHEEHDLNRAGRSFQLADNLQHAFPGYTTGPDQSRGKSAGIDDGGRQIPPIHSSWTSINKPIDQSKKFRRNPGGRLKRWLMSLIGAGCSQQASGRGGQGLGHRMGRDADADLAGSLMELRQKMGCGGQNERQRPRPKGSSQLFRQDGPLAHRLINRRQV